MIWHIKKIFGKFLVFLLILGVIFFIFSSYSTKIISKTLSYTSLKDTISWSNFKHDDEHEGHDEESMTYFENEFEFQPYTKPFVSSIELIKFSLYFLLVSIFLVPRK